MLIAAFPAYAAMPDTSPSRAATFFPILPIGASAETQPSLMPLASNHPIDSDHRGITRSIIVIHDFSRDAGKALSIVSTLAGAEDSNTMILAPQFLLDSDIVRFADKLPDKGKDFAHWPLGSWETGADSLSDGQKKGISSFTALDILLMYLADHESFPDLKEITVIGHGEGGDFVQRYAAVGQAPGFLAQNNIKTRFVAADASSYLYMSLLRPRNGRQGFSPPDPAACKDFNAWPYGMDNLDNYAKRIGANAVKANYAAQSISYLVGEKAGKDDPSPDTSCSAMLQGADRPLRAINYITYVGLLFGEAATKRQQLTVVPNTGYDAAALYGSTCGMTLLFGDGDCTPPALKEASVP